MTCEQQRLLEASVLREVWEEWTAIGRMHAPPDDASQDDDRGYWDEVARRTADRLASADLH
jgi:hypothetical protein